MHVTTSIMLISMTHRRCRFADVFGLDLADVKTFLDEIPKIPRSAYSDLKDVDLDLDSDAGSDAPAPFNSSSRLLPSVVPSSKAASSSSSLSLVPMFNQPGGFANFFDLLRVRKVCLENAYMVDASSIKGTVRVQNIAFHKRVVLRYTTTEWMRSADVETEYLKGSCDGFSDKFNFSLNVSPPLGVGQRLQFCLRYHANEDEHWDSNDGKNYVFQCLSVGSNGSNGNGAAAAKTSSASSAKAPAVQKKTPATQVPLPVPAASAPRYGGASSFSQSPSAMSEDPWLRYL